MFNVDRLQRDLMKMEESWIEYLNTKREEKSNELAPPQRQQ